MRIPRLILCAAAMLPLQAWSGPLETGRAKLFARDYAAAMLDLDTAIATPPADDDEEAYALRSVARLADLADTPAGPDPLALDTVNELLGAFGFAPDQRSLLDGAVAAPRDGLGKLALAADSPTGGEVQGFLLDPLLPAIEASLADLAHVSASFSTVVTGAEMTELLTSLGHPPPTHAEDTTFALGEWKLWESLLRLAHLEILLDTAYDLDVDIDELLDPDFVMAVQANVLDPHPNLLTMAPGGIAALLGVRSDLFAAIAAYEAASASIRSRGPCCFLDIDPDQEATELRLRERLAELRTSLETCTPYSIDWDQYGEGPIAPCALVGGGITAPLVPRSLLPEVRYDPDARPHNYVDACDLTDPTLGGLFPAPYPITAQLARGFLRPCGDRVEDAIQIGDGVYAGTLRGATSGPNAYVPWYAPWDPFADVWFRYTAPRDETIEISACPKNPASEFYAPNSVVADVFSAPPSEPGSVLLATRVGVEYQGGCFLIPPTAFDDAPPSTRLSAGQSVWIRVAAQAKMSFTLTVPEPDASPLVIAALGALAGLAMKRR